MKKINLYTFPDYKPYIKDKENCFYFQKEKQEIYKTDKKNTHIYIYDQTYNINKKNNEIIFINNHINKSGTNPLLLIKKKNITFYDITAIYKQSSKGETTICLGSRYNKEKKQHENPSGYLVNAAIQLHVLGYENIFGRLINVTRKL